MSCSRLSVLREFLTNSQYDSLIDYLSSLLPSSKLTESKLMSVTSLDNQTIKSVLDKLLELDILDYSFAVKCPACGLLVNSFDKIYEIEKACKCYHCDTDFDVENDDVYLIYSFKNYPFDKGQQIDSIAKFDDHAESVALTTDSLASFISKNNIDLNREFFSPSEGDYEQLEGMYNSIFKKRSNAKETGDALESFITKLFALCHHFTVASVRLHPNQIDCYVRNTLFIPGISDSNCTDSFMIECKNEETTPKSGYVNKLHSILSTSGCKFGIIASKYSAPRTFIELANKIYLSDKIIIISIDKNDLHSIVFNKSNLLECVERKITEVKLNATKDLQEIGLFNA